MTRSSLPAAGGEQRGGVVGRRLRRAVDRPVFWWSAAAVFLANAALSAAEARWGVALLQTLTALWATVAGVTAAVAPPAGPTAAEDRPFERQ